MCTWCEVRNFASQKFRLTPGPTEKCRILPHRLRYHGHPLWQRWPESFFHTPTPLLFQNFWILVRKFFKFVNPTPVQTPVAIIDPTVYYPCFYLKNGNTDSYYCRNWKVTPDTGPVFPKLLTPGPKKTQNPTGVDSGTPDPVPPLSSGSWFIAFWTVRLSFLWSDDSLCQTLNVCFLKKSQLSKSFMTPHFLHAKSLMIASRQVRSHWGKLPPSPFPKSCTKFFRLIGLKLLICEPKKYFSANQRNSLGILPFFSFLLNLITTVTETIRWHFY